MATGHKLDADLSADLRKVIGDKNLTQVTLYDADFPHDVGQQFVEAVVQVDGGNDMTFDLLEPQNAEISDFLQEVASMFGETVKFFLVLS